MATVVSFKAFCTTDPKVLRRINFPNVVEISFSNLQSKLSQLFNIKDFEISYIDEEDDLIAIDNDLGLSEAIRHASSLSNNGRVVIRLSLRKVVPTTNDNDLSEQYFKDSQASAPEQSSTETAQMPNNNPQDNNDVRGSREEFPFENVLHTSIKVAHNFFAQLSSAIERDLSNLNLSIPRQQNNDESPRGTLNSQTQTENSQTPMPEQQSSSEPVEHPGVICDNCHKNIRGMRWKCLSCLNYDLCQVCKTKKPSVHSHEFRPIPYPNIIHPNNNSRANVHSATCDYCGSVIFGIRHKCINCPDFDLCNSCISLASTQHPNHTFVPIHRPGDPEIRIPDAAFHPGIRCDGCGKSINGIRFKCGNCPDFDFCGNCEASPTNEHDPNHVFIKFKRPVPSPISSTQPLLYNFYSRLEPKSYQKENRPQKPQKSNKSENVPESSPRKSPEKSGCFIPIVRPPTEPSEPRFSNAPTALYGPPLVPTLNSSTTADVPPAPSNCSVPQKEALPPYSVHKEVPPSPIIAADPSIPNSSIFRETPPSEVEQRKPTLNARFVDDVNIPDGTALEPLTQFHKIWKMVNNGDINWPEGTVLLHVDGQRMVSEEGFGNKEIKFPVGPVAVGETVNITADLQAPSEPGKYTSHWSLDDGTGNKFGHRVWCDIVVQAEDQSSNMSASSMIFPVLNDDQKSVSTRSEQTTSSSIDRIVTEIPISSLEELESPTSTIADFLSNRTDVDVNSVISEYDSDEESDTSSTVSSNDSAQDFIVVEKDSDDEADHHSRQSLMGLNETRFRN